MDELNIKSSQTMKLASLTDLLRLVVSIMGRSNVSRYLYYGKKGDQHCYFLVHSIGGWYDLRGLPVTLAAYTDVEPETNFIEYTSPTNGTDEEDYRFVSEIKQSTNSVPIPIIKLEELPDFMI